MQLGVNFEPNENAPFGFDRGGVNALRPRLVRLVLFDATDVMSWIRSAEARRLKVLWTIPVESIGLSASILCARVISCHGLGVTAGVEIGHAPWFVHQAPRTFCHALEQLADIFAWTTEADDTSVAGLRFAFSRTARPLLAGTGFDGGKEANSWLAGFLGFSSGRGWQYRDRITGLGVHAITKGRPLRRWQYRGLAHSARVRWNWPLAFTRVGWQIGQGLTIPAQLKEAYLDGVAGGTWALPRTLAEPVRARWLQEAYLEAEALQASHFVLEADRSRAGVNHWGAYDPQSERPDPVWHRLSWQQAHQAIDHQVDEPSDAVH